MPRGAHPGVNLVSEEGTILAELNPWASFAMNRWNPCTLPLLDLDIFYDRRMVFPTLRRNPEHSYHQQG